ncbi:heavy metal translocating P-type ATPase [Pseudohalocynthiibacter aestuariivivens]|uniref:Heavy metal translocating P-type ATPase n=1 Tax=Pseudohalocynthiibacter aestuariivivens TaxID=1591409 RepID=A0ABV5JK72_9RHOB|nr:heavy metal translocating P-type ATPase [Pseudohalocynthiibacter aestuariivivens]MBS9717402.1 cadmium-translocating P-type ATPase [Pseudohalocynthiibacter aestuariivivens]
MNTAVPTQVSGCPACAASPAAEALAEQSKSGDARILLSLPTIHCSGCISAVERGLLAHPGVKSARVNLTLKRASIEAAPDVEAGDLIKALDGVGYTAHELDRGLLSATENDKAGRDLLMRLAVAGFAAMNVMLLSVAIWSGAEAATRDLFHWISAAIALPTIAFSAQPFFKNAMRALSVRRLNMDVPISLAILLAAGMSLYETTQSGEHAYFDAALSLTFFLLAGRYLDHRTRAVARSAAEELAALEVPRATRLNGETEEVVAIAELVVGDLVRVKPGGRMPVDGFVTEGASEIDRSLLTGETLPVFAGIGQSVSAGEVNLTGPLTLKVTAAGEDSSLHVMADLVAMAESSKNRYTSLADRAAQIYAPGVHLLAFVAFAGWLWISGGDVRLALNIAVAVLIITCPCALGLAVPAVTTAASGQLFRKGMLIKDGTALERLAEIDTVVFDKTGTLTEGRPELTNLNDHDIKDLEVALALAEGSSHPLAVALVDALNEANVKAATVTDLKEVPGYGIEAQFCGMPVRLGRAAWVDAEASEMTATYLSVGKASPVSFTFVDRLRAGAEQAVAELKAQGKTVHLISGDIPAAVQAMAERLGIENWVAEALPEEKASAIGAVTRAGARVLMVGDGLNDTAALAAAHVSISPATALDAARVASDIVLLGVDLAPLAEATVIAEKSVSRIRENFGIAVVYNLIAVPVALLGFATPLAAALAMSLSSISVSLNALRLR